MRVGGPLALVASIAFHGSALGQELPPVVEPVGVVDTIHGIEVPDPYRWLEDLDSERTKAWARDQDERARRHAAEYPAREAIRERVARIASVDRYTAPTPAGDRLFYLRFPSSGGPGTSPGTALLTRPSDPRARGEERVVVDPRGEGAPADLSLSRGVPDPLGRRVAYGTTRAGSSWETIRVRDVETGADGPDSLTGLRAGRSGLSWSPDGRGFYYERFPLPEVGEERSARLRDERLYYHRLGTPQTADELVFAIPGNPEWGIWHRVSDDGRYLVAGGTDPGTQHVTVFALDLADPEGGFRAVVEEPDAVYALAGNEGPVLWLYTDLEAPRGRVVAIDLRSPARASWRELVPEAEETISSWVLARGLGDVLIVGYLRDALNLVRAFDARGRHLYDLDLPAPGSIWSGFVGRQGEPAAYYVLSGLADPGSIYRLDTGTGASRLVFRPDLAHDPEAFRTEQVFLESGDGTRIPMFLVRGPNSERPGPVWMYGYGFGGWPAAPWFQPQIVAWLEMGGTWALPNTRGGGAYGEEWHAAGSRLRKQTAVDDYLAATEWLIEEGVTTPELMVANASSAGGAIAGAAIVQRPDLYGAAVLDYPVLDMIRYHRFTAAGGWRSEYGTAEDPEEFRALLAYSPVHNVEPGACLPATLVSPGENDQVTPPFHAYKFVAALGSAQACGKPVLLRVSWGAGHAAGADLESSIETWSDQLAFLARTLGEAGWSPRLGEPDGKGSH